MPSKRKPHDRNAGYVCERKSKHPLLPGHFVVYDRQQGFDCDADERWILMHDPSSRHVACRTLDIARDLMKRIAEGHDDVDLGQHEARSMERSSQGWPLTPEQCRDYCVLAMKSEYGRSFVRKIFSTHPEMCRRIIETPDRLSDEGAVLLYNAIKPFMHAGMPELF